MVGKQETVLKQRRYLGQGHEDTLNTMIMVGHAYHFIDVKSGGLIERGAIPDRDKRGTTLNPKGESLMQA